MSDYQRNLFNDSDPSDSFGGLVFADVVPRSAPDPEAVARLEAMHGQPVTIRYTEFDASGVRTVETEALLLSTDAPLD